MRVIPPGKMELICIKCMLDARLAFGNLRELGISGFFYCCCFNADKELGGKVGKQITGQQFKVKYFYPHF